MIRHFYDDVWRTSWGDMQALGPVHRHLQDHVVRIVGSLPVRRLVEVGCGSGDNLAALARSGDYLLTGVDISQQALELARQRIPQGRLLLWDIEKAALPEQFDLALSLQVLEHVLDDMAALRHIARMARPFVLVSTVQGRMRPSEIDIGHVRNYSALELRRKLEAVGLQVLKTWGWGFPFYSPLYRTLAEWLPGGPPVGSMTRWQKIMAQALYYLYRFNLAGRGDILFALAKNGDM
jgi:2-polyprenyl-3-methyl-5-hydroxy-6-metoxy-1,4-benzoquinol methylase